ncbi:MAG: UDP-N-acetylmuramoyl-L-alanyl-D-glutamate--2,6-diaminopimelate ligase [Rickettsia endosymbiont of Pentastiridius leporinus]
MSFLHLKQLFQQHNIQGLSIDSRSIKENEVFFALKGQHVDGNNFIEDVLNKGIQLIITDDKKNAVIDKIIYVENILATLYEAIEIIYPKKPQNMIAVTGTNGKSSVVSYIAQIYSLLEKKAASIGTLGVEVFGTNNFNDNVPELTTLDYLSFRKIAHKLAENGIEYLAFEASSHGLDQQRLGELKVKIACFISFSQDHLDYHHTKEDYLLAKLKLFTDHLSQDGIAILNSDIEEIEFIKDYVAKHNIKFITVGKKGDLKITKITGSLKGQNINFIFNDKEYNFSTSIIGSFQASNLLIAVLSIYNTNFDFDKIISVLTEVKAVKGRMERIEATNIFIDYAHTPDALEKTLAELKNVKRNKLNIVFGCGGNRDTTKRKLMGEIASRIADNVIVTDDNPRHEDPKLIRAEIISGIEKANYIEIADREEAIKYSIDNLKQNDILLIAGKGHENYQIIGDKKLPFDDVEIGVRHCEERSDVAIEKK